MIAWVSPLSDETLSFVVSSPAYPSITGIADAGRFFPPRIFSIQRFTIMSPTAPGWFVAVSLVSPCAKFWINGRMRYVVFGPVDFRRSPRKLLPCFFDIDKCIASAPHPIFFFDYFKVPYSWQAAGGPLFGDPRRLVLCHTSPSF